MDINLFIQDWLDASNACDTKSYLEKWKENAVLEDPSVGQTFKGHSGIKRYFETYFIGYETQTKLTRLIIVSENRAHIEAEFTGNFPGGKIRGTFDLSFKDGKITKAKADLI